MGDVQFETITKLSQAPPVTSFGLSPNLLYGQ